MFVVAGGLLGLIVLLATLQYRWLGQISQAERERTSATLRTNASSFAEDFDRELNRAYLLFQLAPIADDRNTAAEIATRYDRWQATARFPRLIKEIYTATPDATNPALRRFNASSRHVEPAEWPAALDPVRAQLTRSMLPPEDGPAGALVRAAVPLVWPDVPALVVSAPVMFVNGPGGDAHDIRLPSHPSYSILLLDADYIRGEMLPSLSAQYFRRGGGGVDYEVAVVPTGHAGSVYASTPEFRPAADAAADAAADMFYLRVQDFGPLVAEVSRFTLFSTPPQPGRGQSGARTETVIRQTFTAPAQGMGPLPTSNPMSVVVEKGGSVSASLPNRLVAATRETATGTRVAVSTACCRRR